MSSIVSILVAVIVVGALVYILQLLPIDALIKRIAYVIIVVLFLLWALQAFGLRTGGPTLR